MGPGRAAASGTPRTSITSPVTTSVVAAASSRTGSTPPPARPRRSARPRSAVRRPRRRGRAPPRARWRPRRRPRRATRSAASCRGEPELGPGGVRDHHQRVDLRPTGVGGSARREPGPAALVVARVGEAAGSARGRGPSQPPQQEEQRSGGHESERGHRCMSRWSPAGQGRPSESPTGRSPDLLAFLMTGGAQWVECARPMRLVVSCGPQRPPSCSRTSCCRRVRSADATYLVVIFAAPRVAWLRDVAAPRAAAGAGPDQLPGSPPPPSAT